MLKDAESPSNRYKFALTCIKLGKYEDAEMALTGARLPNQRGRQGSVVFGRHLNLEENKSIPNGAGGYYYLGFVCERQGKIPEASQCY